jgi:hypothetical protein
MAAITMAKVNNATPDISHISALQVGCPECAKLKSENINFYYRGLQVE